MTEKEKLIELRNKTNDPINHLYYDHAIAQQEEIDKHIFIYEPAMKCGVCQQHKNPLSDHGNESGHPENFCGIWKMGDENVYPVHVECYRKWMKNKLKAADEQTT